MQIDNTTLPSNANLYLAGDIWRLAHLDGQHIWMEHRCKACVFVHPKKATTSGQTFLNK